MQTRWLTVVGEVADAKPSSPDEPSREQYYEPVDQTEDDLGALASPNDLSGNSGYIVLRSLLPPEEEAQGLRPDDRVESVRRLSSYQHFTTSRNYRVIENKDRIYDVRSDRDTCFLDWQICVQRHVQWYAGGHGQGDALFRWTLGRGMRCRLRRVLCCRARRRRFYLGCRLEGKDGKQSNECSRKKCVNSLAHNAPHKQ